MRVWPCLLGVALAACVDAFPPMPGAGTVEPIPDTGPRAFDRGFSGGGEEDQGFTGPPRDAFVAPPPPLDRGVEPPP
ncbi:MAG: hypothetical protein KC549_18230, partial [Myxococcales bacterium]|nr:hypothetical protein [Myxococcales bacterium]